MVQLMPDKILNEYITFLKDEYLNTLAEAHQTELLELLNLKEKINFSRQELLFICKNAFELLLDDLENRKTTDKTINYLTQLNLEMFAVLADKDLETNINLLFLISQKKTLLSFIPDYTSDITTCIKLVQTIENIYLNIHKAVNQDDKKEEKLKQSEKQLSLIYNSTSDLMLLISVENAGSEYIFRFVSANKSYMNVLKFYNIEATEEMIIGRIVEDVGRDIFKFDKSITEFINMKYTEAVNKRTTITYEESLDDPVHGRFYSETTLTPIFDENDYCTNLLFVSRDITSRKLAEEEIARQKIELNRSNEELQQFAYVASHDLQEPLRMIGCFVQLLEKKYQDSLDPDTTEYINFTVDGVKRMQSLLHGLLDYSRISTRDYQYSQTDFNEVLEVVKANLLIAIEDNQVQIISEELPTVNAFESQMVRLLQNLLSNAIKYKMDNPPVIKIAAKKKENEWLFSVNDNGIGIKEEYFERIFNIFQRLHTRDVYEGEGLGLAICKKIIERHKGRIWLESEPGVGSTFFFTIPA
jgi:signal transduction histidine kinase